MNEKKRKVARRKDNAPSLGFEADLFKTAFKLRGNMEPSDYKHVALGLIFLKYISDAFETRNAELLAEDMEAAEDRDEYLADNVFWVPKDARWFTPQGKRQTPRNRHADRRGGPCIGMAPIVLDMVEEYIWEIRCDGNRHR